MPDGKAIDRDDELGHFVMRQSQDGGQTWGERVEVPFPITAIDTNNTFKGKVKLFW
jgi:hypothetical protein